MKSICRVIFVLTFIVSCTSNNNTNSKVNPGKFCIPDSLMSQIVIDTANLRPAVQEINLIGKITYDQDKVVKLYPLVSGNVIDVKVSLGDYVNKGQILAVIRSTEIASAENDVVTAKANLAVTEKNSASTEDMFKSGIASEKEYQAAREDLEKARSEYSKAQTVINIYGGKEADYIVSSPISGFIVEKFVNTNMQIRPDNSSNLFTISDLSNVWVIANVYESDISKISIGENTNIVTIAYPDKVFRGVIDKIYNMLDPDNKTMKVRIKLKNTDNLLKPEMFANVAVHVHLDGDMLAVPKKAIIFDQNKNWVVIYNNKCDLQIRQVEISMTTGEYSYLHAGMNPGERIVTNLQLLLYDEINQ